MSFKSLGLRGLLMGVGVLGVNLNLWANAPQSLVDFVEGQDRGDFKKNVRDLQRRLRDQYREKEKENLDQTTKDLKAKKEELEKYKDAFKEVENKTWPMRKRVEELIRDGGNEIFNAGSVYGMSKNRTLTNGNPQKLSEGIELKYDNGNATGLRIIPYIIQQEGVVSIEYKVEIDPNSQSELKKFSALSDDQKEEFKTQLQKLSSDFKMTFTAREFTDDKFQKKFNEQLKDKRFTQNAWEGIKKELAYKISDIGDKSIKNTELYNIEQDLKDAAKAKKEHLKIISNQQKIADWMADNSLKDLDECDIIVKALKISDAAKAKIELDEESFEKCEDKFPKKAETAEAQEGFFQKHLAQADKEEKTDDSAAKKAEADKTAKENMERAQRSLVEMQQLQAYCESYKMSENAKQASDQLTRPIEKIQNAIVQSGGTSLTFAKLCSPLVEQPLEELDLEMGMLEDYSFKASTVAQEFSRSEDGNKQLLAERDALSQTVRKSFVALEKAGAIMGNTQVLQGMIDPNRIHPQHAADAEEKVNMNLSLAQQRMSKLAMYHNCALSGLNAIQAEIKAREEELNTQLGGRGLSGRGGAVRTPPVVGGANNARSAGQRSGQGRNNRRPPSGAANKSKYLNN